MLLRLITICAITLGLTACPAGKDVVVVKDAAAPIEGEPKPPAEFSDGGIDGGGGGSGICSAEKKCRPFESFKFNPFNQPDIGRLIDELIAPIAEFDAEIASELLHILRDRKWYMIPADLKKISAARIGTYFFDADQMAIQNTREVWFDQRKWEQMDSIDRQTLVMHELVMGLRLLQWAPEADLCYARIAIQLLDKSKAGIERYAQDRRNCARNSSGWEGDFDLGIGKNLKDGDYIAVREITSDLMESTESIDWIEMRMKMKQRLRRPYESPSIQTPGRELSQETESQAPNETFGQSVAQ